MLIVGAVLLFSTVHSATSKNSTSSFTYTPFVDEVMGDKVSTAAISTSGSVTGKLVAGGAYTSRVPTALNDNALSPLLLAHHVDVTGTGSGSNSLLGFVLLPLLLIGAGVLWLARNGRKKLGGMMGVGRSKAKVYDEERPSARFADIAGYEGSKAGSDHRALARR